MKKINVNISWDKNFCASSMDVLGCISVGDTLEEMKANYKEALDFHIEGSDDIHFTEYELIFKLDSHATAYLLAK